MSIDLNWETLTTGPDGDALAERIRSFVNDKFQTVPLPRFIKSVNVHDFGFGTIPPQLDLKDVTDPLPDFYEDDEDDDQTDSDEDDDADYRSTVRCDTPVDDGLHLHRRARDARPDSLRRLGTDRQASPYDMASSFLGASTPGIMGGPGLSYFQNQFGTGTHTPLAAVAGAHMSSSWLGSPAGTPLGAAPDIIAGGSPSHSRQPSQSSISVDYNFMGGASTTPTATQAPGLSSPLRALKEKSSVSTLAPTASSVGTSRPPTRDALLGGSAIAEEDDETHGGASFGPGAGTEGEPRSRREPRAEDVQAVFRILYSGDVRLNLTAEILLDYPMPSFVGIPLKLNITGLSFDGVGVLARIRKRLNFCFLSPEDALAAVGADDASQDDERPSAGDRNKDVRFGGLLQEIRVESEIGERQSGKQSLKNVGKVERFVLEQIRRIFEEELVYPSFWTFLV